MKKFSLIIFVTIFLVFTNFSNQCSNIYWIRLEYLGDGSKPFPIIIFYTENSIDTTNSTDTTYDFFASKIRISETEFFNISESIKKINFSSQPPEFKDSFAVIIQQNNQREILFSSSALDVKQIFDSVLAGLKNHEKNRIIEIDINEFKRRLGIAIKI